MTFHYQLICLKKFRNKNLKNYGFCPSHYLNAPGLSWDAMLKMKKIKLIPDSGMYNPLRNVQEVKFLIFVIDKAKPTINI